MSLTETVGDATVSVHNVGGIEDATVELEAGVNVLAGRNATNRTSLLGAIMAALGSDRASLKGDADEGRVELELDGETYTRTFERRGDSVVLGGDPYVEDATAAELGDLYAFLLEDNEARQAVARGEDLRELIMRPVDTAAIRADVERLEAEKRQIDEELDRLDGLADDLPGLEERRHALEEERESVAADLEAAREEIEAAEADLEASQEERAALEERLDALREARSDLEDVRLDLETERETLAELRSERDELGERREELSGGPEADPDAIADRLGELRERKRTLDAKVSQVQGLVQFNEGLLEGDAVDLLSVLRPDADELTDQLVTEDAVVCWTCGSETDTDAIEANLDRLRAHSRELVAELDDVEAEIEELVERQKSARSHERRRTDLESRLDEVEAEIADSESRLADLEEREADLAARVDDLEDEVDERPDESRQRVLERHREVTELEVELERIDEEIATVEEEIAGIEADLEGQSDLESQREQIEAELTDLRTRIEDLEADAIAAFNDHIEQVLDVLDYENVERIWIERTGGEGRQGSFELHVVRTTDSGAAYEDTVEHLSESEREVTGLVFALAGYLVHDVHETVPFMLLDSLEAIDADRIAALVRYFRDHAPYLGVALLPEDAEALDEEFNRISEI